jgi:branched-chain amino acid aminotransferase
MAAQPGFGQAFSPHMFTAHWHADRGWHDEALVPYGPLSLDPATSGLHYGQVIFEGLKAFRQPDGSVALFRPDYNARRMRHSARRLAMPEIPDGLFLGALRALVDADRASVPDGYAHSLYLRPLLFAAEAQLGVRPPAEFRFLVLAFAAGPMLGADPIRVWVGPDCVRAFPGGTGDAKTAANYATLNHARATAVERGCDQVVWVDSVERRWLEEMGTMNLFVVLREDGRPHLVTPPLTGTILAGATRDSLLLLARDNGIEATERPISVDEWHAAAAAGNLAESFACGTAAVVLPIGAVRTPAGSFTVGDGATGPVTTLLRESLLAVQHGQAPDKHGWLVPVPRGDR